MRGEIVEPAAKRTSLLVQTFHFHSVLLCTPNSTPLACHFDFAVEDLSSSRWTLPTSWPVKTVMFCFRFGFSRIGFSHDLAASVRTCLVVTVFRNIETPVGSPQHRSFLFLTLLYVFLTVSINALISGDQAYFRSRAPTSTLPFDLSLL